MTHDKTLLWCECITCVARRRAGFGCTKPRKEKPMNDKLFFILWQPGSNLPPTVRFNTYIEAREVAKDMAIRHSKPFYVMRAMCLTEPPSRQVKITDLR